MRKLNKYNESRKAGNERGKELARVAVTLSGLSSLPATPKSPTPVKGAEWEEEFDREFIGYLVMTDGAKTLYKPRNRIKSFIRKELAKAREEAKKEGWEIGFTRAKDLQQGIIDALKVANEEARRSAVGEVWKHLWNTCTPKVFKGIDYISWAEVSKELKSLSKRYGLTGKEK